MASCYPLDLPRNRLPSPESSPPPLTCAARSVPPTLRSRCHRRPLLRSVPTSSPSYALSSPPNSAAPLPLLRLRLRLRHRLPHPQLLPFDRTTPFLLPYPFPSPGQRRHHYPLFSPLSVLPPLLHLGDAAVAVLGQIRTAANYFSPPPPVPFLSKSVRQGDDIIADQIQHSVMIF